MKKAAGRRSFYAFFCLRARDGCFAAPAASRCCACGRKLVLRLRARDGAFRAPARVPFFFCKKKGTKENHLDLRFKDPLARGEFRRCGGESVLRLRAQAGAFRAPARVTFFCCQKKVTKENRLDLRSKDPLARGGFRRPGGELAFPWRGGGLRRPHFFLRRKKCGKESRLDLRSKDPWRAMGYAKLAVLISRNWCGGGRCRFGGSLVPLAPLPLMQ